MFLVVGFLAAVPLVVILLLGLQIKKANRRLSRLERAMRDAIWDIDALATLGEERTGL